MKISIIMATYNGENFIERQLESIYRQDCEIDEVIIRDDGSNDQTINIIRNYIEKNNLQNWKLIINEKNLGWRDNFSQLLKDSTGDLVFLADQDDYWYPNKINIMSDFFVKNSGIEVLVSDYEQKVLNGAKGHILNQIPEQNVNGNLYQVTQNMINYPVGRPGWTYAIKKQFIPYFLEIRNNIKNKGHDALMWQLAMSRNSLYHVRSITGIWTMHPESAIAKESKGRVLNNEQLIQYFNDEVTVINEMAKQCKDDELNGILMKMKSNYIARISVLKKETLINWLLSVFHYISIKSAIGDLKRILTRREIR